MNNFDNPGSGVGAEVGGAPIPDESQGTTPELSPVTPAETEHSPETQVREEIARVLHDAPFLAGGATYKIEEGGKFELVLTDEQLARQQKAKAHEAAVSNLSPLTEEEKSLGFLYKTILPDGISVLTKKNSGRNADYFKYQAQLYVDGKPISDLKMMYLSLESTEGSARKAHKETVDKLMNLPECTHCNHGKIFEHSSGSGGMSQDETCTTCDYEKQLW